MRLSIIQILKFKKDSQRHHLLEIQLVAPNLGVDNLHRLRLQSLLQKNNC